MTKETVEIKKNVLEEVIKVLKEAALTYHYLEKDNDHLLMTVEVLESSIR